MHFMNNRKKDDRCFSLEERIENSEKEIEQMVRTGKVMLITIGLILIWETYATFKFTSMGWW